MSSERLLEIFELLLKIPEAFLKGPVHKSFNPDKKILTELTLEGDVICMRETDSEGGTFPRREEMGLLNPG